MSNYSLFNFGEHNVRIVVNDPLNPLFVARDVATALGYKDPKQAIYDKCKGEVKHLPLQTEGGIQQLRVISEQDTYRLVFSSKLKSAQYFQDWVFDVVLPTIRRHSQAVPLPTHSNVFAKSSRQAVNYLHDLQRAVTQAGGTLPQYPQLDADHVHNAMLAEVLTSHRLMLGFEYDGSMFARLVPSTAMVINHGTLPEVIADRERTPTKQLSEILRSVAHRMEGRK